MRSELPAMLAFAGGSLSLSSATLVGLVAGMVLMALANTLAVAFVSHHVGG